MVEKLDFITKHFLALSALVSSFGAGISIVFVSGYLTAFDRGLLWVVEYPDIIKFALIGIGLLAASIGIFGFIQDMLNFSTSHGRVRYIWIGLMSISIMNWIFIPTITMIWSGNYDAAWRPISALLCLFLFLLIIFISNEHINNIKEGYRLSNTSIYTFVTIVLMFLFSFGFAYGMIVKHDDEQKRDVFTKDKSGSDYIYQNSTVIMMLSHHIVFESEKKVFIIPSSDIWRIVHHPKI